MLEQLRRHASSWIVKLVLTLIILSFIFFFGYSRVASKYQNQETYAAMIGDTGISRRKFDANYQASLERLREGFKGEIPENLTGFLRQNVLEQMISRELTTRYARELGIHVSDDELAQTIRSNKGIFPDGNLDISNYQRNFLPRYKQHYGEDFEDVVRRDLLVEKTEALMTTLFDPWHDELSASLKDSKTKHPKPSSETQETQPAVTSSMSSSELFADWLDSYREKSKVQVFDHP